MRTRRDRPPGGATLYGASSTARLVAPYSGTSVIVEISPVGWARLFKPSAETLQNGSIPLDQMLSPAWCADLVTRLAQSDRGPAVKGLLDEFFHRCMPARHPQEELIGRVARVLASERTLGLADAATQLAIERRALLALTKHYFGFGPKLVWMRARFLRALFPMLLDPSASNFSAAPDGYHDVSHFTRDAKIFLGLTPRRFLATDMRLMLATMRARRLVVGLPTSALDAP